MDENEKTIESTPGNEAKTGFGEAVNGLKPSAPGAVIREGKVFRRNTSIEELKKWSESLAL